MATRLLLDLNFLEPRKQKTLCWNFVGTYTHLDSFHKERSSNKFLNHFTFHWGSGFWYLSCKNRPLSGDELQISLLRTRPEFCLIFDDAGKDYKINIIQASLYVRNMTLTEIAYSAIETTLAKATARYQYIELIPMTFLISQISQFWDQENVCSGKPIWRFILAMSTNAVLVGAKATNAFHYQQFGLRSITVYRNGHPIARTLLETDTDKKTCRIKKL